MKSLIKKYTEMHLAIGKTITDTCINAESFYVIVDQVLHELSTEVVGTGSIYIDILIKILTKYTEL